MKISVTPISLHKSFTKDRLDIPGFITFCAERGCQGIDLLSSMHYCSRRR